ncbi:MAG: MBL fold metallo-hydrolase [Bacteroidetes bacterium]|nr:MBL fold metallo-hydrolase [Bacteroidota bacterium]
MRITFLGTGTSQGIPVIGSHHPVCKSNDPKDQRLRVSIHLEWEGRSFVVDCGPDFRQQMLRAHIESIDALLITHEHADHVAGLDDIRPYCFKQGPLPIYATKRVAENLEYRFAYIFEKVNKYPGAPTVQMNIIENEPFSASGLTVIPLEVDHRKLTVIGFRFGDFAYITDAKYIPEATISKLRGVKTLVLNALKQESHPSHFNLSEALGIIDVIKPERAYLTHISHHMGFHEEVQESLPENVFLAYDGLVLDL